MNPYERAARQAKVYATADYVMAAHDMSDNRFTDLPAALEALEQRERDKIAKGAGQHPFSEESWAQLVAVVRRRLQQRAQFADPFAGLTASDARADRDALERHAVRGAR